MASMTSLLLAINKSYQLYSRCCPTSMQSIFGFGDLNYFSEDTDWSGLEQELELRQGTLGRTWVSGPAHKFSVFGSTVMYYI